MLCFLSPSVLESTPKCRSLRTVLVRLPPKREDTSGQLELAASLRGGPRTASGPHDPWACRFHGNSLYFFPGEVLCPIEGISELPRGGALFGEHPKASRPVLWGHLSWARGPGLGPFPTLRNSCKLQHFSRCDFYFKSRVDVSLRSLQSNGHF